MTKPDIVKQIKRDYPDKVISVGREQCILVQDIAQIVEDFLKSVELNPMEHWQPCVKAYFDWFKTKYKFEPDFKAENPRMFKQILAKLRKVADENKVAWTEKNAIGYVIKLMNAAYEDKWLKENFLLKNINSQYSKIRANERARKGNQKIGRLTTDRINEFLAE